MYEVSDSPWLMENGYDQFASDDEVINGEWIVRLKQNSILLIYIDMQHVINILMQWEPPV